MHIPYRTVKKMETPVLIVGGGPVGLALAAELGWRNIPATLVEKGTEQVGPPKMFQVGVRTMEFCRHLGVAEDVFNWGFPADFPMDTVFVSGALQDWEIARVRMPSMGGSRSTVDSPERQRHCPQTWFDPILRKKAASYRHIRLQYDTEFEDLYQDDDGITAVVRGKNGGMQLIRCQYLIGADGYHSRVRDICGIQMRGIDPLDRSVNIQIDAPNLGRYHEVGNACRYTMVGSEGVWATFVTVDGHDRWRLTLYGANDIDVQSVEPDSAVRRVIGADAPYKIVSNNQWTRKKMVADSFSNDRIFLAGDACHAHPPNGGLGMNTGIVDSFNLGWKLEAVLKGWGGKTLLESYDRERRPVCYEATDASYHDYELLTRNAARPSITENSAAGAAARSALGRQLRTANANAWDLKGIQLGYTYKTSPVIQTEDRGGAGQSVADYIPSDDAGARAPHFWMDGAKQERSILDEFGRGFTLVDFSRSDAAEALEQAAGELRIPLKTIEVERSEGTSPYRHDFCLVRPDGQIAWSGDSIPLDSNRLLTKVSGA
ncbi:MAG: hypothetical protein EPN67_11445 [Pusillimonas sp.]|nr:MAG: hypothetical protein EPN67_11445 [Pusillimonas sp.]